MSDKPLPDLTQPKSKWSVGTLTYTAAGLAVLFALLLWGDFAWSMKDRVVFPMTVKLAKERFELNDTLYSILIISFPNFTNIFLMPIVSYLSDRHRGRLGRRIPFLLFTTPFIVAGLIGIGLNAEIGKVIQSVTSLDPRIAALIGFCVFWVLFDFGNTLASAIFNALVNDVVPQRIIGRFFSLFRIISLLAGILYNYYLFEHALDWFKWIFLVLGVLYAAGLYSMCFFVKEGKYPPPEEIPADKSKFQRVFGALIDYFRQCFSVPYYRWIIVALLLANISFHPINDFSIQYAKAIDVPDSTYGQLLAITYCFSIVLSYPLGALADRFHPIRTSFVSLAAYAALMLVGWLVVGNPWQKEITYHIPGLMSGSKSLVLSSFAIVFIIHGVVSGCFFTLSSSLPLRLFPGSIFAQFASANAMILALGTTIIVPAFGYFLDVQDSNYHLLFLLGAALSLISAVAFVKIHFYYKRFGGDENYIAPDVMTRENILKAGDKFRTFIVHGTVAGIIAGCLLGYWFESPTLREEYSWGGFYGNFFEVIQRSSYEVEEKFEIIDLSEAQPAAEIDASDPETVLADAPETGDAVTGEVIMSEVKKKKVAAPVRPWLLSVVTFGLIGLFLGALFPNKRRPVNRAPDEAETA
ncbi:MAG: MFS transporter [Lentisphaeria bacterium]|nr:MFS transporter [Lentisphaeria bacterium]